MGVTVVVVLLLLVSLAQEMNRRFQIQREVQRLEHEVNELEKSVVELENLNQYFKTPDFQERLAREKLSYQAPGEQLVLVPDERVEENELNPEQEIAAYGIPEQWWRLFFVADQGVIHTFVSS